MRPAFSSFIFFIFLMSVPVMGHADSYLARGALENKDYPEARKWYEKLDANGDIEAPFVLGLMYRNAWGVARDPQRARNYLRVAQDRGHIEAIYWLCKDGYDVAQTKKVADLCGVVAKQKSYRTTRGYIYEPDHVALSYYVAGQALIGSGNEKTAALCLTKAHAFLENKDRFKTEVQTIENWASSRSLAWYAGNWKQERPWAEYGILAEIPPCMVTITYFSTNFHRLLLEGVFKDLGLK